MAETERMRVRLVFPQNLIKEPLIGKMTKQFDVMPNIRRAKVTDTVGEVELELEGPRASLEKGVKYLRDQGVEVEEITGNIVE